MLSMNGMLNFAAMLNLFGIVILKRFWGIPAIFPFLEFVVLVGVYDLN